MLSVKLMYKVYIDIRCLQDPNYVFGGIGFHAINIIKYGTYFLGTDFQLIGLLDPSMNSIPEEYKPYFHKLEYSYGEIDFFNQGIFIQPSPMTYDCARYGKFINRGSIITATLIHDFIPFQFETNRYLPTLKEKLTYFHSMIWIKQYDIFFPVSQFSQQQLIHLLDIPKKKSYVTGVAVRKNFIDEIGIQELSIETLAIISEKYFITIGGSDPRKNIEIVLRAHGNLSSAKNINSKLVILGSYETSAYENLISIYKDLGGNETKLHFLNGITDQMLAVLYKNAIATIVPSKMEGFSMPIVEAIACHCPVLASNCEAHCELIKQKNALFNSESISEISTLMEKVYCKSEFRESLLRKQKKIPSRFTEKKVAERFWHPVIDEFNRRNKRNKKRKISKPKIAFVTPYPPDHSGIANYSLHCLKALSNFADIEVYTDAQNIVPDSSINSFKPITQLPYASNEYDRVISVVGNSHFHTKIIENIKLFGGCCIAHDNRLTDFYYHIHGKQKFAFILEKSLGRSVSIEETEGWLQNAEILPTIFYDELILSSQPLIVHSKIIQNKIKKIYNYQAEYLPFCIYSHFTEQELDLGSRAKTREKLGIPKDKVVIISLGDVRYVKGALECIWTISILRQWGINADFYFVGKDYLNIQKSEKDLIKSLDLENHIHFSQEWVNDNEFNNYILGADFAIQLRKGLIGGASGCLQNCISAGLPVVANYDLAQSIEAQELAYTVPDNLSPILIAESIYNAYQKGEHICRLTKKREHYINMHNFDDYVKELMKLLKLN